MLESYFDDAHDVVFTRVGAVYPDAARIVVRYPNENATDALVNVLWRQVTAYGNPAWTAGPTVNLTQERDWTSTGTLDGLWPSTNYECELTSGRLDMFVLNLVYIRRSRRYRG